MGTAIAVAALMGAGAYLVLQRGLVRMAIGFALVQHAVNLLLVVSGGRARRGVPIVEFGRPPADPVGQAFALTAIVIGLATTLLLLALALRRARTHAADDVETDP